MAKSGRERPLPSTPASPAQPAGPPPAQPAGPPPAQPPGTGLAAGHREGEAVPSPTGRGPTDARTDPDEPEHVIAGTGAGRPRAR